MKNLDKYLDKRIKQVNAILKKPSHSFTIETFHSLRVEIKKIRFVADLIQSGNKKFKKEKALQPFDLIFKHAGKVRETHIEKGELSQYVKHKLFEQYKIKIEEKQQRKKINFFSSVNKTDNSLPEKSYRYFCSALKSISKKNVEDYLKHQKKITRRFCKKSSMHPKELHELRKTLKNISYTERLLEQKISNKKSITENLSNILGKWHDMQVTIDHLRKNVKSKKINQQEKLFLEKIILTLISKKDRYFEAIQSGISRMNAGYIKI